MSAGFGFQLPVMTARVAWPKPPADWAKRLNVPVGAERQVHVWAASLAVSTNRLAQLEAILAKDERARAARFHFERHRNRFIAGRGLLREIVGSYIQEQPAALQFGYGPNGKPRLVRPTSALQFNLSHSEELALVAVTTESDVGVDVECVRRLNDAGEMVARFFSPRESAAFSELPVEQQPVAFFNLWTRKEALLKASGEGIGRLLNQVEVSFLPGSEAELRRLPAEFGALSRWMLVALAPAPGYAGALVVAAPAAKVECWRWDWAVV
jgi:4'-phosphopantetheinyl transferase